MYGHIQKLAEAEAAGIREAGGSCDLYQIEETLPEEVLSKMYAPPKSTHIQTLSDPSVLEQCTYIKLPIVTLFNTDVLSTR